MAAAPEQPPEVLPWLRALPVAPEYHPTWAEFQDPIAYIFKIEKEASQYGICKIVPPVPPAPKKTAIANLNKSLVLRNGPVTGKGPKAQPTFTTRQQQIGFCPRKARPVQRPVWQSGEHYTFGEFEAKAKSFEKSYLKKQRKKGGLSALDIETLYWKATVDKPFSVEYANDMPGSAFVPLSSKKSGGSTSREAGDGVTLGETAWNMRAVSRSRGSLLRFMKEEIPGVTCPMVYVAMMFSWFAWHVEDHDLHSLNYLHMGAGKTWYGVPMEAAVAFEEVVRVQGYGGEINPLVTFATLGEKTTVMSPEVFISSGIPCCRLVQNAGEFVVTFPRAYHTGFSHGFNCGEAANIATPEWLRVANDAAVRRASINYPPMVSHFQLLYDLALALCSRTPVHSSAEPRSSRLKDKKKGEGETVVKGLFVKNVIQNNELLHVLGKGSSIVLLPQSSSDISVCSKLRVGSQLRVNPDDLIIDGNRGIKQVSVKGKLASLCESSRHLSLNGNDSAATPSKMLNMSAKRESNVEGEGLSDQRLFSCVTCGILSFSCVAIIQPREAAARYLMSADCSFFNDWAVDCEPIQGANGDPNSSKKGPCTETGLKQKSAPDSLYDAPFQSADNQNQITDPSNEVDSNTENQRDTNALGLLALTYGVSSDSEEDQADQDVPVCGDKSNLSDCSLEGRYEYQSASPPLRASYGGTAGVRSPTSPGFDCGIGLPTIDGNGLPTIDVYVENRPEATNFKDKGHQYSVDLDTNNLALTKTNGLVGTSVDPMKVSYFGSPDAFDIQPTGFGQLTLLKDSTGTSFAPGFDHDSSRMHVFCLEHAVEVEQQLRSIGGAHILLLCHPDYPRIVDEAKEIAEELGVNYPWNDLVFRNATRADEQRIQSALDSEEAIAGNGDWTVKMGINLFYSASLSRSQFYSKQMPYNSVIYNAFGRSSPATSPAGPEVCGRRPAKQKKVVVGKWCGKVWMSNQVHPFLIKREHEEKKVEQERRRFQESPIPDEKLHGNTESTHKTEKTVVTKQYSRKRKMTIDGETTKKAKRTDAVSTQSVDDDSHLEQTRFLKNKQGKHIESGPTKKSNIEKEDAVSSDSMEDDFRQQNRRALRSKQAKHSVGDDDVSDDSMGVDSQQQQTQIAKSKQAKHSAIDFSMVSDDSVGVDSDHQQKRVAESNTREFSAVSDDSLEESIHQLHRRSLRRNKGKSIGRENFTSQNLYGVRTRQQQKKTSKSKQAKIVEREEAALDETTDDNAVVQHKIVRGKQIKPETLQQMKRETPQRVRQGSRRLQESQQQTPRIRNTTDVHAEEPEGGPSTRLRKRPPKEQPETSRKKAKVQPETGRKKAKEQQQTGRIKVNTASAVKTKNASARKTKNASGARVEEAEFVCDIEGCTMSFGTKHELNLHKKNVCPVKGCGKKFFSHKYLVQHRRVHEDDRPLRCPWKGCKMTFKWAWARTEHIRVHTGARPYVCAEPGCGQTFRFVSDFSRHKRKTGHSVKKGKGRSR